MSYIQCFCYCLTVTIYMSLSSCQYFHVIVMIAGFHIDYINSLIYGLAGSSDYDLVSLLNYDSDYS